MPFGSGTSEGKLFAEAKTTEARALGLNVIAHSRSGLDRGADVRMVSFGELLTASDYLSIHAPLTPQTRRIFDAGAIAQMRPTAEWHCRACCEGLSARSVAVRGSGVVFLARHGETAMA